VFKPPARADDAEFFRRLSLDLLGRTPSITELQDFLDDDRADKRSLWIDELLKEDGYSDHFTNIWRSWLMAQTNQQAQFQQPALEAWVRRRLKSNIAYDQIIKELLTGQPGAGNQLVGFPQQQGGESPAAFFQANENKPENLAGATARLFLGIKVECAQCHNHPFDKWTKTQFWEYAAFFAGLPQPNRRVQPQPQPSGPEPREIAIPGTDRMAKARFLDGVEPKFKDGTSSRVTLAEWMTAGDNPFFARAAVNRTWDYFFGLGLVDADDAQEEERPASQAQLLDELAKEFVSHGYDLKFLIKAITSSETYQRGSALTHPSQKDPRLFARKTLRGLTPEQLFDSLAEATEYRDDGSGNQAVFFGGPQSARGQFLAKFSGQEKPSDPQTSILQALYLMNSGFVTDRTSLTKNGALATIAKQRTSTAVKVEMLYMVVLSRKPSATESERFVKYIDGGGATGDGARAVSDVFWVLLNSPEFFLNH
jgi:hypothetical protein